MQEGEITKEYLYRRENGENVYDLYATRNCKNEQNRDIIDNDRLGSYDEFGNYFFTPEIKEELMYMPKILISKSLDENDLGSYDLRSYLPIFGDMFFKLTVTKTAYSLYLIETVNRELGAYVEVYEALVDDSPLGEGEVVPIGAIFKTYHVIDDDDDGSQIFAEPYDFEHILTRKVYMSLLSKELGDIAQFDEKAQFDDIVAVLQDGGEYGQRVLSEFAVRIKDRPELFTIKDVQTYNKAVNEVLLSSLDVVTTEEDKEDSKNRQIYFRVQNIRNENIEKYIKQAHERVDERYVMQFVNKTTQVFNEKIINKENVDSLEEDEKYVLEFYEKLSVNKKEENKEVATKTHKIPEKPILKKGKLQEKEEEPTQPKENLTKEEQIALILDKKNNKEKKTERVNSSKAQTKKQNSSSKKNKKGKIKTRNKKVKKAKGGDSSAKKVKEKKYKVKDEFSKEKLLNPISLALFTIAKSSRKRKENSRAQRRTSEKEIYQEQYVEQEQTPEIQQEQSDANSDLLEAMRAGLGETSSNNDKSLETEKTNDEAEISVKVIGDANVSGVAVGVTATTTEESLGIVEKTEILPQDTEKSQIIKEDSKPEETLVAETETTKTIKGDSNPESTPVKEDGLVL